MIKDLKLPVFQNQYKSEVLATANFSDIVNVIRNDKGIFSNVPLSELPKDHAPGVIYQTERFLPATPELIGEDQLEKYKNGGAQAKDMYKRIIDTTQDISIRLLSTSTGFSNVFFMDVDVVSVEGFEKYEVKANHPDKLLRAKQCSDRIKAELINSDLVPFYISQSHSGGIHALYYVEDYDKVNDRDPIYAMFALHIREVIDVVTEEDAMFDGVVYSVDGMNRLVQVSYLSNDPNIYYDEDNYIELTATDIDKFRGISTTTVATDGNVAINNSYTALPIITSNGITTKDFSIFEKSNDVIQHCHNIGIRAFNKNNKNGLENLQNFIIYYTPIFNDYGVSPEDAAKSAWKTIKDEDLISNNPRYTLDTAIERTKALFRRNSRVFATKKFIPDVSLPTETRYLKRGRYLHTVIDELPRRSIIVAETGMGKTTFFCSYIKNTRSVKGIIVLPTIALVQYVQKKYNADSYYSGEHSAHNDSKLIAVTYASLPALMTEITPSEFFIAIDEIHNIVLSAAEDFRNRELTAMLNIVNLFDKTVFLTGTWIDCNHPIFQQSNITVAEANDNIFEAVEAPVDNNYSIIKVKWSKPVVKRYTRVEVLYQQRYATLLVNILRHPGKNVIFINDKRAETLETIYTNLEPHFTKDDILLLNSEQKGNTEYETFMYTGFTNKKIIIMTQIAVEGVNFNDTDYAAFHTLSNLHPAYIQQLFSRPRNVTPDMLYYYVDPRVVDVNRNLMMANTFEKLLLESAAYDINEFHGSNTQTERILNDVLKVNIGSTDSQKVITNGANASINYLGCSYIANQMTVGNIASNPEYMQYLMAEWSWIDMTPAYVNGEDIDDDTTTINNSTIKSNRKNEILKVLFNIDSTVFINYMDYLEVIKDIENDTFLIDNTPTIDEREEELQSDVVDFLSSALIGQEIKYIKNVYKSDIISALKRYKMIYKALIDKSIVDNIEDYVYVEGKKARSEYEKIVHASLTDSKTKKYINIIKADKFNALASEDAPETNVLEHIQYKILKGIEHKFGIDGNSSRLDIIMGMITILKMNNHIKNYSNKNDEKRIENNRRKPKSKQVSNDILIKTPTDSECIKIFKMHYNFKRVKETVRGVETYSYDYSKK